MLKIISICGVCLLTLLSSLLGPGLATRHSVVFRHEEAPPWVTLAWVILSFFSYGTLSIVTFQAIILSSKVLMEMDYLTSFESSSLSISILLLSFLSPMIANIVRDTLITRERNTGGGKVENQTDSKTKQHHSLVDTIKKAVKFKISKDEIIDEKEEIKLQRREIEMIIPQIEITSDDGFPSYISFSEVDQSKIDPGTMTPVETPSGEFPDQSCLTQNHQLPAAARTEKKKTLSFTEPFISLTSFDARTKPDPTNFPSFDLWFFLIGSGLYNFLRGFKLGQDVHEIDTEVQPVYMVQLVDTSLVSFATGITFVTRKVEFSIKALFIWPLLLSGCHLLGAIIGVSLSETRCIINTLFGLGYSTVGGLLLYTIMVKFLDEDFQQIKTKPPVEIAIILFCFFLGSSFMLIINYFTV